MKEKERVQDRKCTDLCSWCVTNMCIELQLPTFLLKCPTEDGSASAIKQDTKILNLLH
jgi:hypothetical protein